MRSREWHLLRRPQGWPTRADFALVDRELPPVQAGEVVVRNLYLSVDPYMRGRMNGARSYAPPYGLGQVMYGDAVGRVAESADDRLPVVGRLRHPADGIAVHHLAQLIGGRVGPGAIHPPAHVRVDR